LSHQHDERHHDDYGGLHRDLTATLDRRGTLAAHPLRGLSQLVGGDERAQQDRNVTDRAI